MTARRTFLRLALALGLAPRFAGRARAQDRPAEGPRVDLLLVLAVDVSRSISDEKFALERRGYAEAFLDPRVIRAITSGPEGRIAVAVVEWAGADEQRVVVDWTPVFDAGSARAFGAAYRAAPRAFSGRTAVGSAIAFSAALLARGPFAAERRVIDVSGDGTSNQGLDPRTAREAATRDGATTINGIVILTDPTDLPSYLLAHTNPPGGLAAYYRETVIAGAGAFVLTAESFAAFGQALAAKLVREIAGLDAPGKDGAA